MSPPLSATKHNKSLKSSTPRAAKNDKSKGTPRQTLSELSQNTECTKKGFSMKKAFSQVDRDFAFRFTPEIYNKIQGQKLDPKETIRNNLKETITHLELVGWSENGQLPHSFYDDLFASDLQIKSVILRGRGEWTSCLCPKQKNKSGELIDTIPERGTTALEHITVVRTFTISSCALLDLVSRSPNLKTVKFYGSLAKEDHHEVFQSVRFLSELEGVYWPWCNVKQHKPTLRTLVKRNDQIKAFYSGCDITCDFLNCQLLLQVKYLSIIMNEQWVCDPGKTKVLKRYNRNMSFLKTAKNVEALEVRTFDINTALSQHETDDTDIHDLIRRNYETYKLQFWECVSELANLKYMSIHGAWELEEVCRELSKRGIQIEYLRASLMPNSILANVEGSDDNSDKSMVLSMSDAAKHISKLAKLKSLHFTCHDMLCNIDKQSASALKELSDLIWKIEIKCSFTAEVEELLTNILRRGHQNGRSYRIRMVIMMDEGPEQPANLFAETVEKFSSTTTLKESLNEFAGQKVKERYGKSNFKKILIYGIEQAGGGRDKASFDQLRSTWTFYDTVFKPIDMFL